MTRVLISFLMIFSLSTQAMAALPVMPEKRIVHNLKKMFKNVEINSTETCLDEYLNNGRRYNWFAGLTPPIGVAGTAGIGLGGGFVGAALAEMNGITGFSALGWAFGGIFAGLVVGLGTTIAVTSWAVVGTVKNSFIIKTLANAHSGKGKYLDKFYNEFRKKFSDSSLGKDDIARLLVAADQSGKLCDGSLTGRPEGKLKDLVAKKKHLFNFLSTQN